ncbi:MAG: VOC family protein [Pseudomonadota bacterium]
MKIKQLAHIVLYVRDLDASTAWYRDLFDMDLVGVAEGFRANFLSFGTRDHDLALFEKQDASGGEPQDLNHLAFEFDGSLDDYKAAYRRLKERGVEVTGTADHGVAYGIYMLDPDGHTVELYFSTLEPGADGPDAFRRAGVRADPIDIEAVVA